MNVLVFFPRIEPWISKAPMKIAPWFLTEACGSRNPDHAFRNAGADKKRILRKATFFGN
jgi:hypothetical protein